MDVMHPNRSVFAIGDYRHNVQTGEQVQKHTTNVSEAPKDLYGWNPADPHPITAKIGSKI